MPAKLLSLQITQAEEALKISRKLSELRLLKHFPDSVILLSVTGEDPYPPSSFRLETKWGTFLEGESEESAGNMSFVDFYNWSPKRTDSERADILRVAVNLSLI